MSQISRLHSTEIANGNLIDATHLNDEFDQLVSESNSQDSRLTAVESEIDGQTNSLKSMIQGLVVTYNNPNRAVIKPGSCRDDGNTELMEVTADITVDLSASGANGLDTGSETANTWYYLWLIKNTTTGTVAGLFSASNSSPVLPGGYNKKRLLPIAVRNDGSSNIIPFFVAGGWPNMPAIIYRNYEQGNSAYQVLSGGTATSFSAVECTSLVPPISRIARIFFKGVYSSNSGIFHIRETGLGLTTGIELGAAVSSIDLRVHLDAVCLDSLQRFDYKRNQAGSALTAEVRGFVITEVS